MLCDGDVAGELVAAFFFVFLCCCELDGKRRVFFGAARGSGDGWKAFLFAMGGGICSSGRYGSMNLLWFAPISG